MAKVPEDSQVRPKAEFYEQKAKDRASFFPSESFQRFAKMRRLDSRSMKLRLDYEMREDSSIGTTKARARFCTKCGLELSINKIHNTFLHTILRPTLYIPGEYE